jgi:hypothetical protein
MKTPTSETRWHAADFRGAATASRGQTVRRPLRVLRAVQRHSSATLSPKTVTFSNKVGAFPIMAGAFSTCRREFQREHYFPRNEQRRHQQAASGPAAPCSPSYSGGTFRQVQAQPPHSSTDAGLQTHFWGRFNLTAGSHCWRKRGGTRGGRHFGTSPQYPVDVRVTAVYTDGTVILPLLPLSMSGAQTFYGSPHPNQAIVSA